MKHVKPCLVGITAALALALASVPAVAAESDHYSKERPYGNPKSTPKKSAPNGYSLFFLETVGRHGSRANMGDDHENHVIDLWEKAEKKNALTDTGKTLKRDVERFQAAERKVGYTQLSGLGRENLRGIGRRAATSYGKFFDTVKKDKLTVAMVHTDAQRTKDSASSLVEGIRGVKGKLAGIVKTSEDDDLLHYGHDPSKTGERKVDEILKRKSVREDAIHTLRASYTKPFVDDIDDPVHHAMDLHKLFSTAPGMTKETAVTFERYVPKEDRDTLSFVTDAKLFYQHGPGVKGEDTTFRNARPLLKDYFKRLDDRIDGGKTAAVFRLAHGETTMPFQALIKAKGSEVQVPKDQTYSRKTNPWRASVAGRLGGNIEWAAYRNADKKVLVTMRLNEQPIRFHSGCTPVSKDSWFYRPSELKRCLD